MIQSSMSLTTPGFLVHCARYHAFANEALFASACLDDSLDDSEGSSLSN